MAGSGRTRWLHAGYESTMRGELQNANVSISYRSYRSDRDPWRKRSVGELCGQWYDPDFGVESRLVHRGLRRSRNADISRPAIPVVGRRLERGPCVRRVGNVFRRHCQQHFQTVGRRRRIRRRRCRCRACGGRWRDRPEKRQGRRFVVEWPAGRIDSQRRPERDGNFASLSCIDDVAASRIRPSQTRRRRRAGQPPATEKLVLASDLIARYCGRRTR